MLVTDPGIVIFGNAEQRTNASSPMLITLFGIEIYFILKQFSKAYFYIILTVSGILILSI